METKQLLQSSSSKIASRCKLMNTEIILVDTPLGHWLKWYSYGEDRESRGSSHIAAIKTHGHLYPVELNAELEVAIFGKKLRKDFQECASSLVACIIVTDTGVVMAAHFKKPGYLVFVCHLGKAIVWAGVLNDDDDKYAVTVVGKGGIVLIGSPQKKSVPGPQSSNGNRTNGLFWHEENLEMSPLICYGKGNGMLMSDGLVSWLIEVSFMEMFKFCFKSFKLSYCGIIRMSVTDETLKLFTCDGRIYAGSWTSLIKSKKNEEAITRTSEKQLISTVEEVMMGVQQCSERIQLEGKMLSDLDLYLNQVNLTTSFLAEPQKDIFTANVRIVQQHHEKCLYLAYINFENNGARLKLEGKWWKISVTIIFPHCKYTECVRLNEQWSNKSISISVPMPDVDLFHFLSPMKITCHLILGHYYTHRPVCQLLACHVNVNVFHFLTHQQILKSNFQKSTNFASALKRIARKKHFSNSLHEKITSVSSSCHVRVSFISSNINRQVFLAMLNANAVGISEVTDLASASHIQLWHHDVPTDICYYLSDDKINITISGPSAYVVLSAKAAVEKEITEFGSVSKQVTLTPEAFEEAQHSCQIFRFESSRTFTTVTLGHLHQMITKFLSSIPL